MAKLKNVWNRLLHGMRNYPVSISILTVVIVYGIALINLGKRAGEIAFTIGLQSLPWVFLLALLFEIVSKFRQPSRIYLVCAGLTALAFAINGYFSYDANTSFALIACVIVLVALFYLFNTGDERKLPSHLFKTAILGWFTGCIIAVGLGLSLSAFYWLIYKFPSPDKLAGSLGLVCFIWVPLVIILALIPKRDEDVVIPRIMKTLVVYVAFPLFLLLVGVLYIYLGKALILQQIPTGKINWYVSFASLFFIAFSFLLAPYTNSFLERYRRFAGWFMLPLIAVQLYTVSIRVSAYGLTSLRWASIVCIFFSIVFVMWCLATRTRGLSYTLLIAALLGTLLAGGPLGIDEFPARTQASRLKSMLMAQGMWDDGKIVKKSELPRKAKIEIQEAYYVIDASSWQPDWLMDTQDSDANNSNPYVNTIYDEFWGELVNHDGAPNIKKVFGFEEVESLPDSTRSDVDESSIPDAVKGIKPISWYADNPEAKIDGYRLLKRISVSRSVDNPTNLFFTIMYDGQRYDLKPYLSQLRRAQNNKDAVIIDLDATHRVVVTGADYSSVVFDGPTSYYFALDGYFLTK